MTDFKNNQNVFANELIGFANKVKNGEIIVKDLTQNVVSFDSCSDGLIDISTQSLEFIISFSTVEPKKTLQEIYKILYNRYYLGFEGVDTKQKKDVAQRMSNIYAVENCTKEWRKQYE